jgi:hypothetical protein
MSDLLTRLAQRALGAAPPAVQPRLPARYADAGAAEGEPSAFTEVSVEVDPAAPPTASFPPRPAAPAALRSTSGEAASATPRPGPAAGPPAPHSASTPPPPHAASSLEVHEEREADGPTPTPSIAAPPAAAAPRADRGADDPHPAAPPPPAAPSRPVETVASAAPPPTDDGAPREIRVFVEAEDDGLLMPPASARRGESPVSAEPPAVRLEQGRAEDAAPAAAGRAEPPAARDDAPAPADRRGAVEVVKVVEVESAREDAPRADVPGAAPAPRGRDDADAAPGEPSGTPPRRRADPQPAVAEERTPDASPAPRPEPVRSVERAAPAVPASAEAAAAREPAEERPVVRVTIGRIEVRATQPPPAPQPPARPGYTPPVMSLDEYLKREAAR